MSLVKRNRLIGLRGKLLIVALTVLILPAAGLSYLQELELLLKKNHADSVQVIARTIASVFDDNASLIISNRLSNTLQPPYYSHRLKSTIQIDGYSDDWFALQNVQQALSTSPTHAGSSVVIANDDSFYYFLVSVKKKTTRINNKSGLNNNTAIQEPVILDFSFLDFKHQKHTYRFNLITPGWINAFLMDAQKTYKNPTTYSSPVISGQWQTSHQGYSLEFKVPALMINRFIDFALMNNTHSPIKTNTQAKALLSIDPLNELKLKRLAPDNTRLWLLDNQGYINASINKLQTNNPIHNNSLLSWYRRLYLLFMNFPEQETQYGSYQYKISNDLTRQFSADNIHTMWLDTPHGEHLTLAVAAPVKDREGQKIGVLYLEQDNNSLLALQDKTFERILLLTIILFIVIVFGLLFFSTRLLQRIIHLRNDTEQALSRDGQIKNQLFRDDNDEIGDLARSFSQLLVQVKQNNQYLKTLSSKLSHELRTPLTIIKSSLENTESNTLSDNNKKFYQRAQSGCSRLNNLLNRMSEASRLEQSIQNTELERMDIIKFLANYINSIQSASDNIQYQFHTTIEHVLLTISPELIAQLMDKLLTNAASYHIKKTPINILISQENNHLFIEVRNQGPFIDKDQLENIFNSMTSFRRQKSKNEGEHLGLGLYIANLICQYHQGHLQARNNYQDNSVSFIIDLAVNKTHPD